jgi:hypothetical protein
MLNRKYQDMAVHGAKMAVNEFCYKDGEKRDLKAPPIRLAIGTIALTKDLTDVWVQHCKRMDLELEEIKKEIDFDYGHIVIKDMPRPEARTRIVNEVLAKGFSHLFWLDSDSFVPQGAMKSILQTAINNDYKALCLPVYLKRMPLISNIYQDAMFAPICKLPRQVFRIDLTGLAACLIDMEVFKSIQPPYFEGDWRVMNANGINFHLKTGEDTAFFYKLKRANIPVYCEPKFICEHYDREKDLFFPSLIGSKEMCYD